MKTEKKDEITRLRLEITDLEMRIEQLEKILASVNKVGMKQYYSIKEFAEMMSVTPQTIYNRIYSGEIKALKIGKSWRIPTKKILN